MWEIHCNVRTQHDGRTYNLKAGVHDALPDGLGESLEKGGLASRLAELEGGQEFDLDSLLVPDLKGIAKDMGIEGADSMKKADLLEAIREAGGDR